MIILSRTSNNDADSCAQVIRSTAMVKEVATKTYVGVRLMARVRICTQGRRSQSLFPHPYGGSSEGNDHDAQKNMGVRVCIMG